MAEVIELKKYFKGSNEEINKIFHDSLIGIKKYKTNNKDIADYELESLDFLEGYISNLEVKTKDKSWKPEPIENKFLKHYMFFKDSFGKDTYVEPFIGHFIYLTDLYAPILNEDKYYIELVISGIIGNCKELKLSDKNKIASILKDVTKPILKSKFNVKDEFDLVKMNDIVDGLGKGYNPLLISALYDADYPEDDNLEEGKLTLDRIKDYYLSQEELRFYYDSEYIDLETAKKKHDIIEDLLEKVSCIKSFSKKYQRIYLDVMKKVIKKHNVDEEIMDVVKLTALYLDHGAQITEFDEEDIEHYLSLKIDNRKR